MLTISPNKHYSERCKATKEEGDQKILGKKMWRKRCEQQDTSTTGGISRQQHKKAGK